jgi:MoxR-like ATPase
MDYTTLSTTSEVQSALSKLIALRDQLKKDFVAKDDIIEMMLICAVGQEPMVIFGEAGTAKSALISRFCDYLGFAGRDFFKYLLTSFSEPDELLGVVDIAAYMGQRTGKPRFERFGEGGIQEAKIVFLDEVFRANSAILNTLLSIINERVYYESGEVKRAKTRVVYGASNDAPTGSELRAFYSRFPIRLLSQYVSRDYPEELIETGWRREHEDMQKRAQSEDNGAGATRTANAMCVPSDLEICQTWLLEHWSPEDARTWSDKGSPIHTLKRAFMDIVRHLNDAPEQFKIDDRKVVKLFKLVLVNAMLRNEGNPNALPTLTDVFFILCHAWENPELCALSQESALNKIRQVNESYAEDHKDLQGNEIRRLGDLGLDPNLCR